MFMLMVVFIIFFIYNVYGDNNFCGQVFDVDDEVNKFEKKFKEGIVVRVRVFAFRYLEGFVMCVFKVYFYYFFYVFL